jgi:hypothetical protein
MPNRIYSRDPGQPEVEESYQEQPVNYAAINEINIHDLATIESLRNPTGIKRQERAKKEHWLATYAPMINRHIREANEQAVKDRQSFVEAELKKFPGMSLEAIARMPGYPPVLDLFVVPHRMSLQEVRAEYGRNIKRSKVIRDIQLRTAELSGLLNNYQDMEYDRHLLAAWYRGWELAHFYGIIEPNPSGAGGNEGMGIAFNNDALGYGPEDVKSSLGIRKKF